MSTTPKTIDIVIPVKKGNTPQITIDSLKEQTFKDFRMLVVDDQWQNANVARNHGFKHVDAPFVLFADDDIKFVPQALEWLLEALKEHTHAAYSYGAYEKGNTIIGAQEFCIFKLKQQNYISTMSLIRSNMFPGFDESLTRLQDWDLWLHLLSLGRVGVFCKHVIFSTERKPGISTTMTYATAAGIVRNKYIFL